MMSPLRTRFQALVAAILLAAGTALPAYDAVSFHGVCIQDRGPVRIEAAHSGTAHLLTCALGRQFQRSRGVLPHTAPTRWLPRVAPLTPLPAPPVPPTTPTPTLQRSRAPPVPIA
ncbi:MAG TPA: hypothetical protein VLK88_07675 [Gemmatimonadales bacterium]|nr:hypothetical protein [Gemmatimonadales bacterium]